MELAPRDYDRRSACGTLREEPIAARWRRQRQWFRVQTGPVALRLPNPASRRRALFIHDVNHVLTGYDTDFSKGELAIASFDLGNGCGAYWMAWLINFIMFGMALLVRPRETFRAFVRGRGCASLYKTG